MPTDEYLLQVTLGERKPLNGTIFIQEYDPTWPDQYQAEEKKIVTALSGQEIVLQHVGSTSVPGLCAKPILDILLVVEDSTQETRYVPALEEAGYVLRIREPDWYPQRMLDFRDWLRTHPKDRDLYAAEKRRLAQKTWTYVQNYADAKSEVVAEIFRHIQGNT